jgi:hypothetical protein
MNPHRIRLRKPWQHQSAEQGVLWRRRFGRPTGLRGCDSVWLVIERMPAAASIRLNGEPLGCIAGLLMEGRFDVTDRLQTRNELAVLVQVSEQTAQAAPADQPADVFLEIMPGQALR